MSSRTLQELAKEALGIQNACNLTGLGISFGAVCEEIRDALGNSKTTGTRDVNRHPIMVLWACKLADLTGQFVSSDGPFADAYEKCLALAKGEEVPA